MDSPPKTRDRSAKVCDQCRKRKVKCDGILPACSNCAQSKCTCTFSAQLRRKTKRRGHDPKDEKIQELEAEIAHLRNQLCDRSSMPQGQSPIADSVSAQGNEPRPQLASRFQSMAARRAPIDTSRQLEKTAGPIFKHLGRLVCPDDGVDQFAGSSTGVHFALSAQTKYQCLFSSNENFPESVFRLHLLTRHQRMTEDSTSWKRLTELNLNSIFPKPKAYYVNEIDSFIQKWSYLYPILARTQFMAGAERIFQAVDQGRNEIVASDETILYQLLMVLAITSANNVNGFEASSRFYKCSLALYHHITAIGNLGSLQGLLLLLVFYQVTGEHHLVNSTIGSVVRIAHSLGLHRHARRFKFCVGETEIRKRLWWCVYIFDVMISLQYGLPKIINNEDDDNDLPADSDFDDITLTQLPLPLPGENTKMSPFLVYIRLVKILSGILKELYTTTRRRSGPQKIEQLTRELQVWESISEPTIGRFSDLGQDYGQVDESGRDFMSLWLHLLSQMALVYIHRPALTFDPSEPQFISSIATCSKASEYVISLLHIYRGDEQLFRLFPSGPNIIFQCALLCLYQAWHNLTLPKVASPSSLIWDQNLQSGPALVIDAAASLLEELHQTESPRFALNQDLPLKSNPLTQASSLLRHLSTTTAQHSTQTNEQSQSPHSLLSTNSHPVREHSFAPSSHASHYQPEGKLESQHFTPQSLRAASNQEINMQIDNGEGIETSADFLFEDGNGLEYLNQMDESTWTFLSQMGGYSGEGSNSGYLNFG